MTSIVQILVASLLLEVLAPGAAVADSVRPRDLRRGSTPGSEKDTALELGVRAIAWRYGMDVLVMSRRTLNLSKAEIGHKAHVIYTTGGVKGATAGVIAANKPDEIVVKSAARPMEKQAIAKDDIDTLVVARRRGALEIWQKQADGQLVIMTPGNLDLSKLLSGWHAHIVYRSRNRNRAVIAEIVDGNERNVVVKSGYGIRGNKGSIDTIMSDEIVYIVAAQNFRDITAWRKVIRAVQKLPQEPRVRCKARTIANDGPKWGWVVGRMVPTSDDTFGILTEGGMYRVPVSSFTDLEINIGRRRHTLKGFLIGCLSGLSYMVLDWDFDLNVYDPNAGYGFGVGIVASTLIGFMVKTERWVEVSPGRLNLGIAPTKNKGLRAALTFDL